MIVGGKNVKTSVLLTSAVASLGNGRDRPRNGGHYEGCETDIDRTSGHWKLPRRREGLGAYLGPRSNERTSPLPITLRLMRAGVPL